MSEGQQTHLHLESLEKRIESMLTHLDETVTGVEKYSREKNPVHINGQLLAIGETIRKLEKQGIQIPDDLRKLKINLTTDMCKIEEVERLRGKLVNYLQDSLTRLCAQLPKPPAEPKADLVASPYSKRRKKKTEDNKSLDLFSWPPTTRN